MPFKSSEEAAEAARKSWEKRRERASSERELRAAEASRDASALRGSDAAAGTASSSGVSSAVDAVDLAVVRELERKAQAGDIAAAKELREWRRLDLADSADADALRCAALIARLSRPSRHRLRLWLLAELESPAQQGNREGTIDGFYAPPTTPAAGTASPPRDEPLAADGSGGGSEALETIETPLENVAANEPLPADGTVTPLYGHQVTLEEAIADAEVNG